MHYIYLWNVSFKKMSLWQIQHCKQIFFNVKNFDKNEKSPAMPPGTLFPWYTSPCGWHIRLLTISQYTWSLLMTKIYFKEKIQAFEDFTEMIPGCTVPGVSR